MTTTLSLTIADPATAKLSKAAALARLARARVVTCVSYGHLVDGVWRQSTGGIVNLPRRVASRGRGSVTFDTGSVLHLNGRNIKVSLVDGLVRVEHHTDAGVVLIRMEYAVDTDTLERIYR
jgi:hypothetical protein